MLFERIKQIDETKPLGSSGAIKDKNGNLLRENDITILMMGRMSMEELFDNDITVDKARMFNLMREDSGVMK